MLANGNGSGNQGDVYLVTLNFPVNLASQAVNPIPATIPQGQDQILNVYKRVPVR